MTIVNRLALARGYFTDAWAIENLDTRDEILTELFTPEFTYVAPGNVNVDMSIAFVSNTIKCWHRAFDQYRYDINYEAITDDGAAIFYTTFSGIHTGVFDWLDFGPWESTGKPMTSYQAFAFGGFVDRHFTTLSSVWDPNQFANQLGFSL